jgi:hypothetical protein
LWRGGWLIRAIELGTSDSVLLSDVEHAFLKASRGAEQSERDRGERRRKRQLRWTRIAVTIVTGLLLGTVYLYVRATHERNRALAQKLATDSVLLRGLNVDWTTPALLAIESLRRSESPQAYEALWVASSVLSRVCAHLPAPTGTSPQNFDTTMMFSSDGATLAVGGTPLSYAGSMRSPGARRPRSRW